ncbi:Membrane-bound lytic murein transglycosylase D precursor [Candidatus Nitrotoga fabula]|uniref:Membrane-bound lytic murein transglycosylase D n=1 Tax=Candidatus Nitrotoga fabula TaxID=2182327 RepID=A0A916FA45_9PROT|nr:Membrane-bound lytic murein transglycosylase D precursor [Candidatus Nitrotoga fabula]
MKLKNLLIFVCVTCISTVEIRSALAEGDVLTNSDSAVRPEESLLQPPSFSTSPEPISNATPVHLHNDLWQRIRNGYALQNTDNQLVENHEQWYANRPDYVRRMTERAKRYLHFIVEEVERRGMPSEIALLPMIESAFNPGGFSSANAAGIWQFIPSTGKNFGMKQNWWYDGRRNIVSATIGALDYLQKLHGMFGDWELALAAYNWGEGAVKRALDHNRRIGLPTNYASLNMPSETRNYIPKLQAIKNIVDNPASYGLELQPVPDRPYFVAVNTEKNMDVKLAARLANVTLDEFRALNPAHNRPVILQENSEALLLPVDKAETFQTNLANNSQPLVSWKTYNSKKGDRLDKLAARYGTSVETLQSVNGLSPKTRLTQGQMLLVPANEEIAKNDSRVFETLSALSGKQEPVKDTRYTVSRGDTLSKISRDYKVSVAQLRQWNGNLSILKPGQRLIVAPEEKPLLATRTGRNHRKVSLKQKNIKDKNKRKGTSQI